MAKSQTVKAREGEILDQDFITPGRFRELDGFRGLAAFTVVIYHLGVPATQNYPRTAPSPYDIPLGELGIQLFFIISGFVILLSAIKSGSALKFAVSRFSRIYPTYWFALGVSALVYFLYGNPGRHIPVVQTLVNTTMLQHFLRVDNVDQVYPAGLVGHRYSPVLTLPPGSLPERSAEDDRLGGGGGAFFALQPGHDVLPVQPRS